MSPQGAGVGFRPASLIPIASTVSNKLVGTSNKKSRASLHHRQQQGTRQVAAPAGQVMFQPLDTEPVAQPMDSGRLSQFWGTPVMPQPSTPSLDSVRRSKCQQSHKHGVSYPISHINRPLPPDKVNTSLQVISAINNIGLDLEKMAQDQPLDPDFQRLSTDSLSGLQFRKLNMGDKDLYVDVSNGPARPFVPFTWKRRVFDSLHALGHPGIEQTRKIIASKFVWPSMTADVTRWARECVHCQRSKIQRHVTPPIGNFEAIRLHTC